MSLKEEAQAGPAEVPPAPGREMRSRGGLLPAVPFARTVDVLEVEEDVSTARAAEPLRGDAGDLERPRGIVQVSFCRHNVPCPSALLWRGRWGELVSDLKF